MSTGPAPDLAHLARRLGTTPRGILLAAAGMAENPDHGARECLALTREHELLAPTACHDSAALLLTSPASFARDELASALQLLWKACA
ncbi:MAG: hypothetical protein IPK54_12255 [Dokdonella sp.]|uniref:hypothetical protein n=2 Tax=Dokdonella sp. TaxID=2291710 RepID=UPI001B68AF92|nr:hypothetical protein [Dokdonella sp.]MCC6440559.1 hypothetical protein [Rhodanobacteraceae bacterium]MBK8124303.1 hypothetical protein [Dokdonella sp.]MBP6327286.1 hypothetical protein [Dokdonella sp.]MBP6328833.1 hypothetical protein [Dokdonella sp.]HQV48460.1 hypothetical protein [Dokdonella sp.]